MTNQAPFHHRRLLNTVISAALALGAAVSAFAQSAAPASAKFTYGGDFRLRNEYYNGASTLNDEAKLHEQDYFRHRLRLWLSNQLNDSTQFYLRFAAEPRTWYHPTSGKTFAGTGMEWKYGVFDALYFKTKGELFGSAMTLTLGRQDIQIGEAGQFWLVSEGTPADGSWTNFFDAARLQFEMKSIKTKFDLVALKNRMDVNGNLPSLGGAKRYSINDQDENGLIFNLTNTALEDATVDALVIYKRDRQGGANSPTSDIYTTSLRLSGKPVPGWSYFVEGAAQWGTKKDPLVRAPVAVKTGRDISAYGFVSRLTRTFQDARKTSLAVSAEYLSGDDPATKDKDESFDLLWGRYPRVSEIYGFASSPEAGRGNSLTNVIRLGLHLQMTPAKDTTLNVNYHLLSAVESLPTRSGSLALFTQTGDSRGHLVQVKLARKFSKKLSGYILGEVLQQGDFYTSRDPISFFRCELLWNF